jgi:hypothetical protein
MLRTVPLQDAVSYAADNTSLLPESGQGILVPHRDVSVYMAFHSSPK